MLLYKLEKILDLLMGTLTQIQFEILEIHEENRKKLENIALEKDVTKK